MEESHRSLLTDFQRASSSSITPRPGEENMGANANATSNSSANPDGSRAADGFGAGGRESSPTAVPGGGLSFFSFHGVDLLPPSRCGEASVKTGGSPPGLTVRV
ncbi:unnamed protein product, partial [Discosporangium mesarthrocarpum]